MRSSRVQAPLWVAVKVERGYISEARVFESLNAAEQTARKWRSLLNPDYDEAGVVKGRLSSGLRGLLRAPRVRAKRG